VRVLVSARASGGKLPEWAGNRYLEDVANAGVRVFLYGKGYLHAKTISIDSEICSIGSANIDIRSFSINYELNAVLYSERLARELEEDFERDLGAARRSAPAPIASATRPSGSGIRSRGSSRPRCERRPIMPDRA
jgi:cardiolipin synthase